MSPDFDVQECVRRVSGGDMVAAGELVEHLHPLVRRWVRNHLPRRESEEDLVQEVFLKLLQKVGSYQERAGVPFEHWVSRLAVRTCLDALRAERSRPEWRMADLGDGEREWLDYLMHRQMGEPEARDVEAKAIVTRLMEMLSPPDRLVLTLLDLEERSTQEIAQMTGWSRPMVKMRAMRARRKLRVVAEQLKLNPE
jgi:RNA polymerase sigma-70 factor (ECF subfamily)